jgi:hypothetical protein
MTTVAYTHPSDEELYARDRAAVGRLFHSMEVAAH